MYDMEKSKTISTLAAMAQRVKNYTCCIRMAMTSLTDEIPMEEELKETSRMMYDSNGEIFLYYNGVYYSWKIILSILKKQEVITIDSLYDNIIN